MDYHHTWLEYYSGRYLHKKFECLCRGSIAPLMLLILHCDIVDFTQVNVLNGSSTTAGYEPSIAIMTRSSLLRSSNLRSRSCSSCLWMQSMIRKMKQKRFIYIYTVYMYMCILLRGLTVAPGCPVFVSERSSCSPA